MVSDTTKAVSGCLGLTGIICCVGVGGCAFMFFLASNIVRTPAGPSAKPEKPIVDTAKLEQEQKEAEQKKFADRQRARALEMKDTENFLKQIIAYKLESVFPSATVSEKHLTVRVANDWHYQPYQIRLQAAQNVYEIWFRVANTQDDNLVKMTISVANGNEVGGKSAWSGVWVDK